MWLVLANALDPAGPWLASGLAARTFHPVIHLTEVDLGSARIWEHVVGRKLSWFRLQLGDGRWIDSREVAGVINRLHQSPYARMAAKHGAEHSYAVHEIAALLIGCLADTNCIILNSPGGYGPYTDHRRQNEWLALAAAAGLTVKSSPFDSPDLRELSADDDTQAENRVLIIAENLVQPDRADAVPEAVREAAIKLAASVQNPLLELHFVRDEFENWIFHRAMSSTDLFAAGDAALDAVASLANSQPFGLNGQYSRSPFLPDIAINL